LRIIACPYPNLEAVNTRRQWEYEKETGPAPFSFLGKTKYEKHLKKTKFLLAAGCWLLVGWSQGAFFSFFIIFVFSLWPGVLMLFRNILN